jgi:hypothetical protein
LCWRLPELRSQELHFRGKIRGALFGQQAGLVGRFGALVVRGAARARP